jgi:coenzyme F420-0:L-glutamate ligase / coenzyme F420-1:gamma-L-glutamate ligase
MAQSTVELKALRGLPLIEPGDDLAAILIEGIRANGLTPHPRDVLVLAQKIVSKAEGRYRRLADIAASERAKELAPRCLKDPRLVEIILSESAEVMRCVRGVLITRHRLGFVMANAGVDQSNIEHSGGDDDRVLLLPEDPDRSAAAIKARLDAAFGVAFGIVINDSFGRAWRNGVTGVTLGVAGLPALIDMVGKPDLFGRALRVTEIAFADEIAAAASLVMGQADERQPAVLVRGLDWGADAEKSAQALIRPRELDLFQ